MKRLSDLTIQDLQAIQVWRYKGDKDTEAFVEPTDRLALYETDQGVFLAATEFKLQDGPVLLGYCSPTDQSGMDYFQPVVLAPEGPIRFWFDRVSASDLEKQLSRFGRQAGEIFPIRYRCLIQVDRRTVSGVIEHVAYGELEP